MKIMTIINTYNENIEFFRCFFIKDDFNNYFNKLIVIINEKISLARIEKRYYIDVVLSIFNKENDLFNYLVKVVR